MSRLAPISVSTYTRLNHLKQTIEALSQNTLARKSVLYIFSDGPKKGDEDAVAKVREYLHTIDGFKKVHIIEQKINNMQQNMKDAREVPVTQHGKMIRMEDDIVTAPGFLRFINDGLDIHEDDKKIFSIGGFSIANHNSENDFYWSNRVAFWGFGIWKDRLDKMQNIPPFTEIKRDKRTFNALKLMGDDMLPMIKAESSHKINAGDIKCNYLCAKENLLNILPTTTLVKNIGLDGSGVHCGKIDKYDSLILSEKVCFDFGVTYDIGQNMKFILKNNLGFKKINRIVSVVNKVKRMVIK